MLQTKGRFSEWVTLCWMRWPRFLNLFPHSPQQNILSGLGELQSDFLLWLSGVRPWLRRCLRRLERWVKVLPNSPQWYTDSGSGWPDELLLWLSRDLDNCWLPLATSTEVELDEGAADEEEETVEDDCCDDERREECGGSLPMPLIPTPPDPPPTRPDEEL